MEMLEGGGRAGSALAAEAFQCASFRHFYHCVKCDKICMTKTVDLQILKTPPKLGPLMHLFCSVEHPRMAPCQSSKIKTLWYYVCMWSTGGWGAG